jgi:hypothetical protein
MVWKFIFSFKLYKIPKIKLIFHLMKLSTHANIEKYIQSTNKVTHYQYLGNL